jgi:hypothetical protein
LALVPVVEIRAQGFLVTTMGTVFTNVVARKITVGGLDFVPNQQHEIPEKDVEAFRNSIPVRAGYLKEGRVVLAEPPPRAGPDALPEDLAKALAYINVEENRERLTGWAEAENAGLKRAEVLTAIRLRSERIAKK